MGEHDGACSCAFICVSLNFELCSENGCAEGQTDPGLSLIEVLSVPLETI